MNHTRLPKEDYLPDWALRDNKVTKGDRVETNSVKNFFALWHTPAGPHIRLLHVVLMFYSKDPHQRSQAAAFRHLPKFSSQITALLA